MVHATFKTDPRLVGEEVFYKAVSLLDEVEGEGEEW